MLFPIVLFLHSLVRWLVLTSLVFSIWRAGRGLIRKQTFSKTDELLRHWTMTFSHIQFTIGIVLYSVSPLVRYFWSNMKTARSENDPLFFGLIHMGQMATAVVFITVGAGLAKRKNDAQDKFKAMLVWFLAGLLVICMAIPWPFSPLAFRPYIRLF